MTQPSGAPSNSAFATAIAVLLAVIIGLGFVIHAANSGHHRAEGAAEHWLNDVGDTTRKGVVADATKRAEQVGPIAIARANDLIPADTKGKSAFPDLEVGKAVGDRVPFRLHQRVQSGKPPLREGSIVLAKLGDSWRVTGITARQPGEKVPSEGGKAPSKAPSSLWALAILAGVGVTAGASAIVQWAARSAARGLPA